MRPSGRPPTPRARSIASEPVESVSTFILALLPRRMMEPSPNCLVMEESARSMFFSRAVCATGEGALAVAALDMVKKCVRRLAGKDSRRLKFFADEASAQDRFCEFQCGAGVLKANAKTTASRMSPKLTA